MRSAHARKRRRGPAFLYSVPIGVLGGLIGLGGAEFRLPVLAGPLGYPPRQAIPLNLAVSLVTLVVSLAIRINALSASPLAPLFYGIAAMISGAVVAAFFGPALAGRLSDEKLERVILILLVAIGVLLIVEGVLPKQLPALLPDSRACHLVAGTLFGLLIGLVSSLLGVAGGELIIPTLVFAFGADIKTAGTASLIVSLPTVIVGVARYATRGAFDSREDLTETLMPMGFGSVIGALIGGLLVGILPASVLKVVLGVILNVSAWRIFRGHSTGDSAKVPT
ncbi:MAG TPA: sulfite exporter TauE/SafE family protein [Blastocatellia bacterium]|nr:sulfite exporter TauE/SafE family protein [Blastocatellia bacterium]